MNSGINLKIAIIFAADVVANFKEKKQLTSLAKVVMGDPQMQKYLKSYKELIIKWKIKKKKILQNYLIT